MFSPPQSLRSYVLGHTMLAAAFLSAFYFVFIRWGQPGSDIAARRNSLEKQKPQVLLVGNSLLRAAVDADLLGSLSGYRAVKAHSNGSASAWWYLYLKNVVARSAHQPEYVGIMFRDTYLTKPKFRVTDVYQKPIRRLMSDNEPLVQDLSYGTLVLNHINSPLNWVPREARGWLSLKIEKRTEDLLKIRRATGRDTLKRTFAESNMVPGSYDEFQRGHEIPPCPNAYDFSAQVDRSYLPHILALFKEHNITPIFIRAKRRQDLSPDAEPEELQNYIADLRRYLQNHEALWLDFSQEQRITLNHFGSGDHLNNTTGRKLFTEILAHRLSPRLARLDSAGSREESLPSRR